MEISRDLPNKSLILYLRDKENLESLIKETSSLPEDISISERAYCYKNRLISIPVCPICGKPRKFFKMNKGYFATCGDDICKSAMIAKSNSESKRDWVAIQEKMKATYAKNHNGYTHNMQDPEFKKKFFQKYKEEHNGETCGVQSKIAKENREKTIKEKYGNTRQMFEQGIINKYGSLSNCISKNNKARAQKKSQKDLDQLIKRLSIMGYSYISAISTNIVKIKCNRCGLEFEISKLSINRHFLGNDFKFCSHCDYKNMKFRSHFEQEIVDYIRTFYDKEILLNNKSICGCECDIIIPDLKIAIEANGVYWHTEEYKDINAHINKKILVESKGYNLIQIWEDDWKNNSIKQNIIKSRLKSKFGYSKKIYARLCEIKEATGNEAKEFLNANHIQGYIPSTYKIGLYFKGELVELITVGKTRKLISGKSNCLELYRLCSKCGYNIIGGFSKLLTYFTKQHKGEELISYADCDWCQFENNGYKAVGFEQIKVTSPGYTYNIQGIRENRLNYTKDKLIKQGYNKNLSEIEIMHNRGFYRIFDSGNILFKIKL